MNPWGPEVEDIRSARLVLAVASTVARKGKKLQLDDFLLGRKFAGPVQSKSDMMAVMMGLVARGQATVHRESATDGKRRDNGGDPVGPDGRIPEKHEAVRRGRPADGPGS